MIEEFWHPPVQLIQNMNCKSEENLRKIFSLGSAIMAWGISNYRTPRGRQWLLSEIGLKEYQCHPFITLTHGARPLAEPISLIEEAQFEEFDFDTNDGMEIMEYLEKIGGLEPGSEPIAVTDFSSIMGEYGRWLRKNPTYVHQVLPFTAIASETMWPQGLVLFDGGRHSITTDKLEANTNCNMCEGCAEMIPCTERHADGQMLCRQCISHMNDGSSCDDCTHIECSMCDCIHSWNEDAMMFEDIEEDINYEDMWPEEQARYNNGAEF